jgi:hypothetical protein
MDVVRFILFPDAVSAITADLAVFNAHSLSSVFLSIAFLHQSTLSSESAKSDVSKTVR